MIDISKHVPLHKIRSHEAHDFTVWLEESIDVLNKLWCLKFYI